MNAIASTLRDSFMETSKLRIGLDIATICFMLGLSFNAGVEYNRIDQIASAQRQNRTDIDQIKRDEQPLSERVARMEAILSDIRDELRQNNDRHTAP